MLSIISLIELEKAKKSLFSIKGKKRDLCCICMASDSNIKFDCCKHICTCVDCFMKCLQNKDRNLRKCPLCRKAFNYEYCEKI